jgi:predicted exporter
MWLLLIVFLLTDPTPPIVKPIPPIKPTLIVELIPQNDDQRVHLNAEEFRARVARCTVNLSASKKYCECVVRGFEMFLPIDDWNAVRRGGHMQHTDIAMAVDRSCHRAALP